MANLMDYPLYARQCKERTLVIEILAQFTPLEIARTIVEYWAADGAEMLKKIINGAQGFKQMTHFQGGYDMQSRLKIANDVAQYFKIAELDVSEESIKYVKRDARKFFEYLENAYRVCCDRSDTYHQTDMVNDLYAIACLIMR